MGNTWGWCMVWAGLLWAPPEPELTRFEYSQVHMGMPFNILLYAPDEATANRAAEAAFARIKELDETLSDYKPESELSRLSASAGQGKPVPVGDDLWNLLAASQKLSEQSDGAFDLTVGPYVKLWRRARRDGKFPSEKRLAEAREAVGYQHLKLNETNHTALLERPGMRLDPGGVAVGYTLDEAMKAIKAQGVTIALIDGSGDVLAADPPPGKQGWTLGVAPPTKDSAPTHFLSLANMAATTAGDTFQFVEIDGKRYSHVVDPRTGLGLTHRLGVTVVAPTGLAADSLDTAASVLGVEAGEKVIAEYPGAEAIFIQVLDDGTLEEHATPGLARFLVEGLE